MDYPAVRSFKLLFPALLMLVLSAPRCWAEYAVERRDNADDTQSWTTANNFRVAVKSGERKGAPVLDELEVPAAFNPDSVRVIQRGTPGVVPAKVNWTVPYASVSWRTRGPGAYDIYFDHGSSGETKRLVEPAMVGAGERITYGRAGVRGEVAVGLHPHAATIDFDKDGATDLIISCPVRLFNGTYLFRNIGSNKQPLFDKALWLGPGKRDAVIADFNGDGAPDLVNRGGYYNDLRRNRLSAWVEVKLPRGYHVGRDDLLYPADWDNDGKIDVLNGISDWRDYGWDDAFNSKGEWVNGPLHGYVYLYRNVGTNQKPNYAEPERLKAGGNAIDLRGSPAPNPVDWFGRGRLDLIGGDFIDTVTIFENTGTRGKPKLAAGRLLKANGKQIKMPLCMIQPRVVDWYGDGRPSLIVAEEDGTVAFFENTAPKGNAPRLAAPKYFQQIDPFVKSGVLIRPDAVDWNGDGKLDILAGNSAGFVQYFENVGTPQVPAFADRGYLKAGGEAIQIVAGPNLSIQGPAEEKWGYTNISVADWDVDGKLDLLLNSIVGEVLWYRNIGSRTKSKLAAAEPVEVAWQGPTPKPEWNWWNPKGKQLVTEWRTTPKAVDWNRDGLPDLVMLDHEGYLAFYERYREAGRLKLRHPQRIFRDEKGEVLRLNAGRAGKSGRRKLDVVDWDGDGDLDLIADTNNAAWYENTGTQEKPVLAFRGNLVKRKIQGHSPAADAADWTGDGKLDLIIGGEDGFLYFFDRNFLEQP